MTWGSCVSCMSSNCQCRAQYHLNLKVTKMIQYTSYVSKSFTLNYTDSVDSLLLLYVYPIHTTPHSIVHAHAWNHVGFVRCSVNMSISLIRMASGQAQSIKIEIERAANFIDGKIHMLWIKKIWKIALQTARSVCNLLFFHCRFHITHVHDVFLGWLLVYWLYQVCDVGTSLSMGNISRQRQQPAQVATSVYIFAVDFHDHLCVLEVRYRK